MLPLKNIKRFLLCGILCFIGVTYIYTQFNQDGFIRDDRLYTKDVSSNAHVEHGALELSKDFTTKSKLQHNTSTSVNSTIPFTFPKRVNEQSYIRSAFRISNSTIRLTILRHLWNRRTLYYKFGSASGKVAQLCNLKGCRNAYAPNCRIIGIIGVIEIDPSLSDIQDDTIRLWSTEGEEITVPITDVRPREPPHQLAVCLQPIFLHDETSVFIQFFEHWIAHGATKFYIYRQNYAQHIQHLLDFYASRVGIDLEYVDWSNLPSNDTQNPNELLFRTEVYMGVFDCIHRARYTAKYVAQMDLDEILMTEKTNLLHHLDRLHERHPNLATVQIKSKKAEFITYEWQLMRDFRNMTFTGFHELWIENKFFPPPAYSKLIHRPERVLNGHHHTLTEGELIPGARGLKYRMVLANEANLYILHLRRERDNLFKTKAMRRSQVLKSKALEWEESFKQHIYTFNGSSAITPNTNMKKIEQCRKRLNDNIRVVCGSVHFCAKDLAMTNFYTANNSWYTL